MNVKNIRAWRNFTYKMFYPGILGSMIYSTIQDCELGWGLLLNSMFITQLLITIFYCLDYLHLNNDLLGGKPRHIAFMDIIFDIVISALFCLMSCAISHEELLHALVFLLLISILMLVYVPPRDSFSIGYFFSKAVLICIVLVFIYVSYRHSFIENWYVPIFFFICTFGYGLHVFVISERTKKRLKI